MRAAVPVPACACSGVVKHKQVAAAVSAQSRVGRQSWSVGLPCLQGLPGGLSGRAIWRALSVGLPFRPGVAATPEGGSGGGGVGHPGPTPSPPGAPSYCHCCRLGCTGLPSTLFAVDVSCDCAAAGSVWWTCWPSSHAMPCLYYPSMNLEPQIMPCDCCCCEPDARPLC